LAEVALDKPNEPPANPTGERPRRIIKRYSNRKLYDTRDSRYVTLLQIAEMVRAGEEVQIIDNATKEDKTEVTLALIISEELKSQPRSVPLGTLRDLIHQRGERLLSQLREGPIGRLLPGGGLDPRTDTTAEAESPPSPDEILQREAQASGGQSAGQPPGDGRMAGNDPTKSEWGSLEQARRVIDERIRTILATFSAFRELQHRVDQLTERVASLEAELARRRSE
jgi:polyhydroxyalkanoate synthesis repressor PhaR